MLPPPRSLQLLAINPQNFGPTTWFFQVGGEQPTSRDCSFLPILVYAQALETHPVQGHRDVHVLRDHPHYRATVWVLDARLPAVGLQEAVGSPPLSLNSSSPSGPYLLPQIFFSLCRHCYDCLNLITLPIYLSLGPTSQPGPPGANPSHLGADASVPASPYHYQFVWLPGRKEELLSQTQSSFPIFSSSFP